VNYRANQLKHIAHQSKYFKIEEHPTQTHQANQDCIILKKFTCSAIEKAKWQKNNPPENASLRVSSSLAKHSSN
jgi:hypothetical protein